MHSNKKHKESSHTIIKEDQKFLEWKSFFSNTNKDLDKGP